MLHFKGGTTEERFLDAVKQLNLQFPVAEIAEKMKVSESTVSLYVNNKRPVSKPFLQSFCQVFKLDYDLFVQGVGRNIKWSNKKDDKNNELNEPEVEYGSKNVSDIAILKLANANELLAQANKTLADNSKDLIELVKTTVNEKRQIPEAFDTMIGNLLESLAEVLTDNTRRSKPEVAALLSKAFHDGAQGKL